MPAESSSRRSEPREPLEQLFYWRLEFSTSSISSTEVKRSFDVPCSNRRCSSSVNDYVISFSIFFFGFHKQHSLHFFFMLIVHISTHVGPSRGCRSALFPMITWLHLRIHFYLYLFRFRCFIFSYTFSFRKASFFSCSYILNE